MYITSPLCLDSIVASISVCHAEDRGSIPRRDVFSIFDGMSEWLRRAIRNRLGFSRAGSNPAAVVFVNCKIKFFRF